jgi:AraC-like DNA-binding protein
MEPPRPTSAFLPALQYATLLDVLAERGHERGAVLAAGGYLTLPQMEALALRACALEPGISCEVGARVSLMSHGWLSVAALSSATIGQALVVVAEHFALVSPLFEMSVREADGRIAIRLTSRWTLPAEVERYHTEAFCSSLQAHVPRLLFHGSLPTGLEVSSWPAGPELGSARPHHEIRFPAALGDVRLPLADASVHRAAVDRCRAHLAAQRDPVETAAAVRRQLIASGAPFPDVVAIAKRLGTSSRSLRRRLRDEGTSFRALLDEVRSTLADEWLDDPKRSITEIGFDLGYTDAANFTRAYRRANGLSPSAARKQRLGFAASA